MKRLLVPSFTFCRMEPPAGVNASCLRWCFSRQMVDKHAFIPSLRKFFISGVKYKVPGQFLNKDEIDHKYEFK